MTHEEARRPVFRLWLFAFAGIASIVCAVPHARASSPVGATQFFSSAPYSQQVNGRKPTRVFTTDAGVYELDSKELRVWQRTGDGFELVRPDGATNLVPRTEDEIRTTRPRPQRFSGIDAAGNGTAFNEPSGLAKDPGGNRFAVVSGGEYQETKLNVNIPAVQVYDFEETADAEGTLSSLRIEFRKEFRNAFFRQETGVEQVFVGYTNITDIVYETTSLGPVTNWVFVKSVDPLETETNRWLNSRNDYGYDAIDEGLVELYLPSDLEISYYNKISGIEYPIHSELTYTTASTNVTSIALYDYQTSYTTNASILAYAADAAFLGSGAIVVPFQPIPNFGYEEVYNDRQWDGDHFITNRFSVPGLAVFNLADETEWAVVYPCATNLPGTIGGIAVDPSSGDLYVSVPTASAVYRYAAPGAGPESWLTAATGRSHDALAVQDPIVPDPAFVAGVPGAPATRDGWLSSPQGLSLWSPDGGSPILLVADRANNRVAAFDTVSTMTATNWLGTSFRAALDANGRPVDPAIGFVEISNGGTVLTNWYRVEEVAFPLFSVTGGSNPLAKPDGVFGQDGTNVLAVADTVGYDVRLYEIDLAALDSPEILALSVYWPGAGDAYPSGAERDFVFDTDAAGTVIACWDAPKTGSAAVGTAMVVHENDDGTNWICIVVAPARVPREYTLSITPEDGLVPVLESSRTIAPGETSAQFPFFARDGVEKPFTNLVYYAEETLADGTKAWVETDDEAAADRVVTNICRASPVYTVEIGGAFSTNAPLVVANVAPTITNAIQRGHREFPLMGDPYVCVHGIGVSAADVEADSRLTYVWWATDDIDWALNHLDWAVENHDWASSAQAKWTPLTNLVEAAELIVTNWIDAAADIYTVTTNHAALFAAHRTTGDGLVTNALDLLVARGVFLPLPYRANTNDVAGGGIVGTSDILLSPWIAVCTVIDKDGGATVITFPDRREASDYDAVWSWEGPDDIYIVHDGAGIVGDRESTARYRAQFLAVSGTNVVFKVWLLDGDPLSSDTVTLQFAESLSEPSWEALQSVAVGMMDLPATNDIAPAAGPDVRFYRIVQP